MSTIRRTALAFLLLCLTPCPSSAQVYSRDSLRIPFAAAGPRGLEALLVRPADGRRYPLALMSHGTPRKFAERASITPGAYQTRALELARRGFAVLIVMRRGYGDSGTMLVDGLGPCGRRDFLGSARIAAQDLKAAVAAIGKRSDVTTDGMIAIGASTGGLASVALAADPPPGLAAVINFAGGHGSLGDRDVCDQDRLVDAFGTLGKTARVPMLWVYSENDLYFWPELAQRFHSAFQASGGRANFAAVPAFGGDGHFLFSSDGASIWTPLVDIFLREQNLGLQTLLPPPTGDTLPAPRRLTDNGRESFKKYLLAGDHRAFAASPKGAYGWRAGLRSEQEARTKALENCAKHAADCSIYAVNDRLESDTTSRAR